MHQPLRSETGFFGTIGDVIQDRRAQRQQRRGVVDLAFDTVGQQGQRTAYIADHLHLREIHLLHRGLRIADVDDRAATRAHHERRLLRHLVANGHDHVGLVDGHVHVVALAQRRRAHVQARTTGHRALAHLRGDERNTGAQHEGR
ncbi:hypothetical protein D3C73_987280 [compost metagenome]